MYRIVNMISEAEIVAGLKAKDPRATTKFVEMYSGYIYNVCNKILRSWQEAEEATQDTCIKVINKIEDYNTVSPFKVWVFTIAYRTGIDYKRKQKKFADPEILQNTAGLMDSDASYEDLENKKKISQLLKHISEEDATLVQLFYLNEFSVKEIVDATGLTESNIKIKLFRARKEMAKHIDKYFDTH